MSVTTRPSNNQNVNSKVQKSLQNTVIFALVLVREWMSFVITKSGNYMRNKIQTKQNSKRRPRAGATFERNLFNGLAVFELCAHDLDKGFLVDDSVKPPREMAEWTLPLLDGQTSLEENHEGTSQANVGQAQPITDKKSFHFQFCVQNSQHSVNLRHVFVYVFGRLDDKRLGMPMHDN